MRDLFPVLRVLGMLMCMFALAMALPGAVSWWQQESVWRVYPLSMAVTMGAGLLLWWLLRHHRQELQPRHGVILVTLVWVLLPLAASLPLVAAFALFHGHAHHAEMGDATLLGYSLGFALATAALHAAGLALARAFPDSRGGRLALHLGGGGIAGVGVALLGG